MITTPSEALDRLGVVATGRPVPQGEALQVPMVCAPGVDPSKLYLTQPTPAMLAYDASLPTRRKLIPAPSRHQDWKTPTTEAEQARWSEEAEQEARRRGWMTARRPTWDGSPHSTCFDCWLPLEDA